MTRTESGLIVMPVVLDELADVLDQSPGAESFIDLHSGSVWPAELFELDQGPDDFDPDFRERWLVVVGLGSRARVRRHGALRCDDHRRRPLRPGRRRTRGHGSVSTVPVGTRTPPG